MKPSNFEYFRANTIEEALMLLEQSGGSGKILAGGQSIIPMLNLRLARPDVLIDINYVSEMGGIEWSDQGISIGALTRHREIEYSPIIKKYCPLLSEAAQLIGHPQIRNRGTFGGSLCHADPTGEFPTSVIALEATLVIKTPSDEIREIKAEEFFLSYLTTTLDWNEILLQVKVPALPPRTGHSFVEISDGEGGNAIVCVAALVTLDHNNKCTQARIALGGVGCTPIRAEEAEQLLIGQFISEKIIAEAGSLAVKNAEPESDMHVSSEYKLSVGQVLTQRAIKLAVERARG